LELDKGKNKTEDDSITTEISPATEDINSTSTVSSEIPIVPRQDDDEDDGGALGSITTIRPADRAPFQQGLIPQVLLK
jgi:hypothetical protein